MMDRRGFLRRLGFGTIAAAAAASGVLDIERLLWMPGERAIFLPTIEEAIAYGGDTFTPIWITMEVAREFENKLRIMGQFNRSLNAM